MRKTLSLVFIAAALMLAGCKKKYDPDPSLPPATQTGANTFGCLVNGKVLVPQNDHSVLCDGCQSPLSVSYQPFVSVNNYNQINLSIGASDEPSNGIWRSVYLLVKNTAVTEGKTIILKSDTAAIGASARYTSDISGDYKLTGYNTTQIVTGELTISKLDQINKFISGTFKFNAVNSNKDTVHVTDGRFDVRY